MSDRITLREYESLYYSDNPQKGRRINKTDWQHIRNYVLANPAPNGSHLMEVKPHSLKAEQY